MEEWVSQWGDLSSERYFATLWIRYVVLFILLIVDFVTNKDSFQRLQRKAIMPILNLDSYIVHGVTYMCIHKL